jgi:hypothetical protein
MKASTRCAVVLVAICSWFAISNHCAFAALATKTDSVQTECPFHSKPTKQKQQPSQVQCCKVLRAVVLIKAKSWAHDDAKFSDVGLRVEQFALVEHSRYTQGSSPLETGPPDARSFAELILQRSLFAHAPPHLA